MNQTYEEKQNKILEDVIDKLYMHKFRILRGNIKIIFGGHSGNSSVEYNIDTNFTKREIKEEKKFNRQNNIKENK